MNDSSRRQTHLITRVAVLAAIALLFAGCGTPPPASGTATNAAVTSPAVLANGKLVICSDVSNPPMEFFDERKQPLGADIELGNGIAAQLGLQPEWRNTKFPALVPTLIAQQCDAIMSTLYIKPEREQVVDFVPYIYSGQSIVVTKGNPKQLDGLNDKLCGLHLSVAISTTAEANLQSQSSQCTAAGRAAISINRFDQEIAGLQDLALGRSDAYATTTETAAYYMTQQRDTYAFAGESFNKIKAGIAVRKGNGALATAITTALQQVKSSGAYDQILAKWNLTAGAL